MNAINERNMKTVPDPDAEYTAKEVAAMFGVTVNTVYKRLEAIPSPFSKKRYSGAVILAAMAQRGHAVVEQPPSTSAADFLALSQTR